MGQCAGSQKAINANVAKLLEDDGLPLRKSNGSKGKPRVAQTKLLLLGTGNSGKTTVFKQFQLAYGNGFSKEERIFYKQLMIDSTISTIRKMLQCANDLLFEGEMKDEDFDRKLVEMYQEEEELRNSNLDPRDKNMTLEEFLESGDFEEGRGTELSSMTSVSTNRSTNTTAFRSTGKSDREPHGSDLSEASLGDGGERSSSILMKAKAVNLDKSGSNGKNKKNKQKNGVGEFTVISEDVAHLADIIKSLPEGTQLYEKVTVCRTVRRKDPKGNEITVEEEEDISVSKMLKLIWNEPVIQRVFAMESKIPTLEAPIAYYMENLDRIAAKKFIPSETDMLFARKQTRKVQQLEFDVEGRSFVLYDVGGQQIERRNWIKYFEEVDAVLYVVGLDGYSQLCIEDGATNRMRESLDLFRSLSEAPFFAQTNIILFFNKDDIFREKIKEVGLNTCFKSYPGDPHDYEECIKYISRRFSDVHAKAISRNTQRLDLVLPSVYPYVTVATAVDNMRYIITACQSIFLRKGMAQSGIASM